MYDGKRVYGPYKRKDGRQIVILKSPGSKSDHQTVSYPKYLVEMYLGRYLTDEETVDHIDGNFNNNSLDNLRVIPRALYCKSHVSERRIVTKKCVVCGKEFVTTDNHRKTCGSKNCRGKCAHINGHNLGNDFVGEENRYIDNRYIVDNIHSVVK